MKKIKMQQPKLGVLAGAISVGLLSMGYTTQTSAITNIPSPSLLSHVTDSVTDNGGGSWTYDFTVFNDTTSSGYGGDFYGGYGGDRIIVDWEMPYFADMNISNIQSPLGWSHAIETIGVANQSTGWNGTADWQTAGDPWKTIFDNFYGSEAANPYNDGTQVLHWYISCGVECFSFNGIFPQNSKTGFSFDAGFAEGQAPYQASWDNLQIQTGDPAFPNGIALPNSPSINPVPLPAAWLFMVPGLVGIVGMARKKQNR